ncbi:metallophosphoesterase [Maribacter sp. 2307UL18-2]|uniref:metallophosphoesterase n=1 Tax=Maribacter sp. 2307UL18-2 TaxID=3386274 RepID=UPI0039BD061D
MSGKGRTLVIGDIHSGLKGLQQVLERADVRSDDTLIFLGDYVDGWSQAVETIEFLIQLSANHECVFIRGNHDELCLNWLKEGTDNPTWIKHGGAATLASYDTVGNDVIDKHIAFYQSLTNYHLDDQNRLFLHAGFTNLNGVDHEYFPKMFYWDRTLWELALSMDKKLAKDNNRYPKRLTHYNEIYIGHTPISKSASVLPKNAANVWNMDTGAAFKGALSLMDVDTKEIWQSDPVYQLYPLERGRN